MSILFHQSLLAIPVYRRLLIAIDGSFAPGCMAVLLASLGSPVPSQFSLRWWLVNFLCFWSGYPRHSLGNTRGSLSMWAVPLFTARQLATCFGALAVAIGLILRLPMPPRSSWTLLWLLLTCFTGLVRFALRDVLLSLRSSQHKQQLRCHLRRR